MKYLPNSLVLITTLFIGILLGLYISRNYLGASVQVSVPAHMQTAPAETVPYSTSSEEKTAVTFPIRLNRATKEELMALPNIGETLASRILEYRAVWGRFTAVEELLNIEGIGPHTMEPLWGLIALD